MHWIFGMVKDTENILHSTKTQVRVGGGMVILFFSDPAVFTHILEHLWLLLTVLKGECSYRPLSPFSSMSLSFVPNLFVRFAFCFLIFSCFLKLVGSGFSFGFEANLTRFASGISTSTSS